MTVWEEVAQSMSTNSIKLFKNINQKQLTTNQESNKLVYKIRNFEEKYNN